MSEMREKIKTADNRHKLADAIRGAQVATADRGDVVIDMKEADLARIEILAQDLKPFLMRPGHDLQWDFAVSSGLQPRLWIDATSHVMMARDRGHTVLSAIQGSDVLCGGNSADARADFRRRNQLHCGADRRASEPDGR